MTKKYNIKDYSTKTAQEWLDARRWTGFLMRTPIGREHAYLCRNANDAMSIRATASMLNSNINCPRRFSVTVDFDKREVTVLAVMKEQ